MRSFLALGLVTASIVGSALFSARSQALPPELPRATEPEAGTKFFNKAFYEAFRTAGDWLESKTSMTSTWTLRDGSAGSVLLVSVQPEKVRDEVIALPTGGEVICFGNWIIVSGRRGNIDETGNAECGDCESRTVALPLDCDRQWNVANITSLDWTGNCWSSVVPLPVGCAWMKKCDSSTGTTCTVNIYVVGSSDPTTVTGDCTQSNYDNMKECTEGSTTWLCWNNN